MGVLPARFQVSNTLIEVWVVSVTEFVEALEEKCRSKQNLKQKWYFVQKKHLFYDSN
jgi:hypothetical protein